MIDIKEVESAYHSATVDWKNSRFTALSTETVLSDYKRAAAFIPELIEEIASLRAELKEKS